MGTTTMDHENTIHNRPLATKFTPLSQAQKDAIYWAVRWHRDFPYGVEGMTDERITDFLNDTFQLGIISVDDLTRKEASDIISQLNPERKA